jgi:hypothetical protein
MLDQVLAARAFLQDFGLQLPCGVELVVAREDNAGNFLLIIAPGDQIAADDLQPAIAFPDLVPEVAGAVTGGIGRILFWTSKRVLTRAADQCLGISPSQSAPLG